MNQVVTDTAMGGPLSASEALQIGIQALIAIGTLLIVIIAIFGQNLRKWLFRPKLQITTGDNPPFVESIKTERLFSGDTIKSVTATIKIRVLNTGSSSAMSCKGIVYDIFSKRKGSDTFYKLRAITPTPLLWNNDARDISLTRDIPSYLEVARIEQPESLSSETDTTAVTSLEFAIFLSVEEPGQRGVYIKLGKGTFIIPVVLYADNLSKPIKKFLKIFWDGTHPDHMNTSNFYTIILRDYKIPQEVKEAE
ncbi:MAG: hypothetical protein V3U73_10890 [bacterium]